MVVKSSLLACALVSCAAPAFAGDLVVTVTTKDGKPLSDAVVTLPAPAGAPAPKFPWKLEIAQKDKQFAPFVLVAPVGAEVAFPNFDKFRHHVYSFSKGNKFELELYGSDQKRSVTFKATGVAALGCNIHDNMVAFVYVTDSPYAARANARGVAELKGAPDGAAQVTIWHPHAKSRDQVTTTDITIAGVTRLTVAIDVAASHGH
jgi:plastocyanin